MEFFTMFSCKGFNWPQRPEANVLESAGLELGGRGRLLGARIKELSAEAVTQETMGGKCSE